MWKNFRELVFLRSMALTLPHFWHIGAFSNDFAIDKVYEVYENLRKFIRTLHRPVAVSIVQAHARRLRNGKSVHHVLRFGE